ncbi:ankyrin repeat domain-containing protein 65-like [Sinocyclocheilus rhinocerous]|nr:PREDICTED: ankyrin repeat domain-containing protein 65-like [Sinocyclocheilus rhinocerous]
MTPLHYSTLRDNVEAAKLLLHYGADVNAVERLGQTPLHLASERGHCKVLKVLLDKGADPAIRSSWRETAEDVARAHDQLGVVQLLLQHQAVRMRDQAQDSVEKEKK